MDIRHYIAILWRRKWVIAIAAAVTVAVTIIGLLRATPTYVASTTLRVLTATAGSVDWVDYDTRYAERLMNTYTKIATSGPVLQELADRVGLDEPPEIEVEIVANTELMRVTVEDRDPALAAQVSNTLAEILVVQSEKLYSGGGRKAYEILGQQLAQLEDELRQARTEYGSLVAQAPEDSERIAAAGRSIEFKEETYATFLEQYEQVRAREAMRANMLSVVDPATPPRTPSKPRRALSIALGLAVGSIGGLGVAFLLENLDTTLYTTQRIQEVTDLPVLGRIPPAKRQWQVALFNGNPLQAEAFRRLRTTVFTVGRDVPLRTLLVTSAGPGEGKSTVVANLAFAIAQAGRRTIVLDGDLRQPTLHKIFDLSNELGLSSVLRHEVSLDGAVQNSTIPGVCVLTSGPLPPNPAELLDSPRMTALIEQLAQQFDIVLLDTPALLAVTDAAVRAPTVDGVMLVVGRAQARREAVQAACQHLSDVKARWVGVVVNRAEQNGSYYGYHGNGYL
jgi:succinoglycan biosynthesis transport protein ExoP